MPVMHQNEITGHIINAAFKVHSKLGPGLLESSYEHCLAYEIEKIGLHVELQKPLPLVYEEVKLECGYRIDLLVENEIVVEVKATDALHDIHIAQLLTYLRLMPRDLGLLLNFNVKSLRDGIKRVTNKKIE